MSINVLEDYEVELSLAVLSVSETDERLIKESSNTCVYWILIENLQSAETLEWNRKHIS